MYFNELINIFDDPIFDGIYFQMYMSYIEKRRSDMFLHCCIELPWLLKSIPTNHFDFFGIILKISLFNFSLIHFINNNY